MGSSPTGHPTKKSAVLNSGLFLFGRILQKVRHPGKAAALPGCRTFCSILPKRKSPLFKTADFLVGCPVGLEPTVSRSTIWRVNRLRYGHHIDAPEGTRTPGPLLRRQLLYPAELRALIAGSCPRGTYCVRYYSNGEPGCQAFCKNFFTNPAGFFP